MFPVSRPARLKRAARLAALCLPLVLLPACGGGGGGGGPGPAPVVAPTGLVITSANQKAVAADALDSSTNLSVTVLGTELTMSVADAGAGSGASTVPCTYGGTFSLTATVAHPGQLVSGDTLSMTANGCREFVGGVQSTLDGSLSAIVVSGMYAGTAAGYPAQVVVSIVANGLAVATPTETLVITGDQTVDITLTSYTGGYMTISGMSLEDTVTANGRVHASAVKNYHGTVTVDNALVTLGMTARVETDNPRLGNVYYDLATPVPLAMNNGAFTGGSLKITSTGSGLLVGVTAYNTFSLQLDANGDGTYELTTPVTLDELRTLL